MDQNGFKQLKYTKLFVLSSMLFQSDPHARARRIFNTIAPVYNRLDDYVKRRFGDAMRCVADEVPIVGRSVLDIGTGTGAWAALFRAQGASHVHGVDFAERMVRVARKKYHPDIGFSVGDARDLRGFDDKAFDIVTASFVLHGMKQPSRHAILAEMKRISSNYVIIHDYHGPTPLVPRLLEYLERSDYQYFKVHFMDELQDQFTEVKRHPAARGTAVYFAVR